MSKKTNKMAFYLIPLGIAINFVFGEIVLLLGLPIYLDTVGTIIVGALCGPMYSIITAVATCGLLCITSPETLFYLGGYLASGILVGVMGKRGWFRGIVKTICFALLLGCVDGLLASFMTMTIYGGYTAFPSGIVTGFVAKTFDLPILTANVLAEITTDVADKIPSVIIAFLALKNIPDRFLVKLPFGDKYINADGNKT